MNLTQYVTKIFSPQASRVLGRNSQHNNSVNFITVPIFPICSMNCEVLSRPTVRSSKRVVMNNWQKICIQGLLVSADISTMFCHRLEEEVVWCSVGEKKYYWLAGVWLREYFSSNLDGAQCRSRWRKVQRTLMSLDTWSRRKRLVSWRVHSCLCVMNCVTTVLIGKC